MKKFVSMLVVGLLCSILVVPVSAHDGWSQVNSPIVEKGETAYVELLFGNHSNHHASYRIEGNWNTDNSSVFVTTPNGEKADISSTIFYTGELTESEQAGVNNYYIASFSSSTPGVYIVSVEGDSIFAHGGAASRTLRNAKSFVAISEVPTRSYVADYEGYDQLVSPDRAEFIPLFNPAALNTGEEVSVQLVLKGEPLADTEVTLIQRSTSDSERFTTDTEGKISFTAGAADYYLLRAKPSTDEQVEGEYDTTNYESTMTFHVQNGQGLELNELAELFRVDDAQNTAAADAVQEGSTSTETELASAATGEQDTETNIYFYTTILLLVALILSIVLRLRKKN